MNTIKDCINYASNKIGHIEANLLMEHVLGVDKLYLIINSNNELDKESFDKFNEYLTKIEDGYPLQYITHKQEFCGLSFYVDERVLIPQPDTEVLVEETIKTINSKIYKRNEEKYEPDYINKNSERSKIRILDLCTGSGAIAISIYNYINDINELEYHKIEIVASDISTEALKVAKKNYENLNISNTNNSKIEIDFIQSDMFQNIDGKFDIIVSNPPYIKNSEIETLSKDVQNEPHLALDGGEDGLKFYKVIKENIHKYLKEQGTLLLEIGYDQKEDLLKLFENANCIKDLSGNNRVIIYKKN